jgi:hypothetical protein
LLASLTPRLGQRDCSNPLQCGQSFGAQLADRALAGLNRLMEQGVEPVARLIWSPAPLAQPPGSAKRAPLREPPITADPLALRELQESAANSTLENELTPEAPDLPPPLVLLDGQPLPQEPEFLNGDADALAPAEAMPPGDFPLGAPTPPPLLPPRPLPPVQAPPPL